MKNIKALVINLAISLGVGGISALLTSNSKELYAELIKPPFSPPGWIFGVVWPALFLLMGISAFLVLQSNDPLKKTALTIYGIQLAANMAWSLLFFGAKAFLFAFFWLILLIFLVVSMLRLFYNANRIAGILQIPYVLWLLFAAYLNLGIYMLNR